MCLLKTNCFSQGETAQTAKSPSPLRRDPELELWPRSNGARLMHLESPSPSLHPSTTRSSSSCFVQTLACVSVSAPQAADSSHAASTLAYKKDFSVQGSWTAPACAEVNACSAAKHCSRTLKLMANVSQETDRHRFVKKQGGCKNMRSYFGIWGNFILK